MKLLVFRRRPETHVVTTDHGITIDYAAAADARRDSVTPGPSAVTPNPRAAA